MPSNPGVNYQGRLGELRLLDNSESSAGAAATPYAFVVKFENMDFTANARPRPPELNRLDRERLTDDVHRQIGSEEDLFNPTNMSFSAASSSLEQDALLEMIGFNWINKEGASTADGTNPWTVKGTPNPNHGLTGLTSTVARARTGSGQYSGGIIDSKGSAVVLPAFADKKKIALDIEVVWFEVGETNKWGLRLKEVHFPPGESSVNESGDNVNFQLTGQMYGEMEPITAFSRARNVLTDEIIT